MRIRFLIGKMISGKNRSLFSFCALAIALLVIAVISQACDAKNKITKPTIRIAVNPWTGSAINAQVAKIILQEKLGYPVALVQMDEYAQWPSLRKGDVDACLEVWPSGHVKDIKLYIEGQKSVENLGLLGVVGKIGWYVPSYVVKEHPGLSTWEGYKDPKLSALFRTPKSGDKGQFLTGDPSWVQYDRDIIKNLGLNLLMVQAGSEKAVLEAVNAAYQSRAPILFYFWTPHSIHAKYQLTAVKLPKYSDASYAKANEGGVNCDYPTDILIKVAWPGLKNKAPDAYQLLKDFSYTNDDQIAMLAMVELEGKTVEAAAKAWIENNKTRWSAWLPIK